MCTTARVARLLHLPDGPRRRRRPVSGTTLADPGGAGDGAPQTMLQAPEQAVGSGRYLAGEHFTVAALYVAARPDFCMRFGLLERGPTVVAFGGRHLQRPAAQAARRRDDAPIPPPHP